MSRESAELPVAAASTGDLVDDLYRRLDPSPEHAVLAYVAIKRLVAESHRPYDPSIDDGRLDRPAEPILGGEHAL